MFDEIPSLTFNIGTRQNNQEFTVPFSFLTFTQFNATSQESHCHLAVVGQKDEDNNVWVLGDSFMTNFYTVFDAEDDQPRVGISLLQFVAPPPEIVDPSHGKDVPTQPEDVADATASGNGLTWLLILAITALLIVVVLCLVKYCRNKQRSREQGKLDLLTKRSRLEDTDSDEEEAEESRRPAQEPFMNKKQNSSETNPNNVLDIFAQP